MTAQQSPEIGRSVKANGIATNYLVEGDGPPVVLIHGSGPGVTGYANWRFVLPRLAPNFRAIAPDMVGFGYTDRPEDFHYTLDNWLDHVLGFLDALGIQKANFIGNSFGGALSIALASRYPERVERMVLMGAAGLEFIVTPGLDAVWGYEPSVAAMGKLMETFAYNQSLITPDLVESRYRASIRPGYQESFSRMFQEPRQEKLAALATPEEQVRKIQTPTLIVHGRDDKIVPVEVSIRLNQLLLHSDLHVFGECGHWTQVERVEQFCALVTDFLKQPGK